MAGAARLVGTDREKIVAAANELLDDPVAYAAMTTVPSLYGDGHAAERIAALCGTSINTNNWCGFEADTRSRENPTRIGP